jgi:hypothetical protein
LLLLASIAYELNGRFPADADIDAAWNRGIVAFRGRRSRRTAHRATRGQRPFVRGHSAGVAQPTLASGASLRSVEGTPDEDPRAANGRGSPEEKLSAPAPGQAVTTRHSRGSSFLENRNCLAPRRRRSVAERHRPGRSHPSMHSVCPAAEGARAVSKARAMSCKRRSRERYATSSDCRKACGETLTTRGPRVDCVTLTPAQGACVSTFACCGANDT